MYKILKGDERKNINQNMTEYEDYPSSPTSSPEVT